MRLGLCPRGAISLHETRKDRICQQWHVAKTVMEQIGFRQIVELAALAHPHRHRKTSPGEMGKKMLFRDQAGHGDDTPAG